MLGPDVLRHASDAGAVVWLSDLGHLAVASDVESLEVDEHLLSLGQIAVEAVLVDGDAECACVVLDEELLVDVAPEVVARDAALDLDVLRDEDVAVGRLEDVGILVDELLDGDESLLSDGVVAEGGTVGVAGLLPVAVHAGGEESGDEC